MCRLYSRRLSTLRPQLDAANVGFVAVGLEELGAEEFVKGGYFNGGEYSNGTLSLCVGGLAL